MAMEMVLNGRFLSADEAYQFGLVNRIFPSKITWKKQLNWPLKLPSAPP
jgi:enoyl-CoA hydratase/carnithine racemase